jgi:hypothetical protein
MGILIVVLYEGDLGFHRRIVIVVSSDRFEYAADSLSDLQGVRYRIWPCDQVLLNIDHEDCPPIKYRA